MVGAGNAFPSVIAIIPLGENVNTCDILKRILDSCQGNTIRYSMLGQVCFTCIFTSNLWLGWYCSTCNHCSSKVQKSSNLPLLYTEP